ncbi:hypothetical protein MAPG_03164 [Magnaporthiopsis poae ATCC 64411]|uniref:Uncharacterized protein n=1 Tax=Magnaporthiopsis poae (strain ATCC 64411 / 73-15) TaxID=644358 RepID=A0A0C4DTA4_MAGP6|nr:hypothetical protein MAPG_03164 [Magnaporthiopsis poae ATCC 64411]
MVVIIHKKKDGVNVLSRQALAGRTGTMTNLSESEFGVDSRKRLLSARPMKQAELEIPIRRNRTRYYRNTNGIESRTARRISAPAWTVPTSALTQLQPPGTDADAKIHRSEEDEGGDTKAAKTSNRSRQRR